MLLKKNHLSSIVTEKQGPEEHDKPSVFEVNILKYGPVWEIRRRGHIVQQIYSKF